MKRIRNILVWVLCSSFLILPPTPALSQNGLKKGATIQDIAIPKLLNASSSLSSFSNLQNKLTIIDFFGTWCVPCLRALLHLDAMRQKFRNDLSVILVSNEGENKLRTFIKARPNFTCPLIVDENNYWNDLIQPPSFPYTIIVNRAGKIIDITEAEAITEAGITTCLLDTASGYGEKRLSVLVKKENPFVSNRNEMSGNKIVQLSQDYIYYAKTGQPLGQLQTKLKDLDFQTLLKSLFTDNEKKAFWINLYNGYTQATLKANPDKYKNRGAFYKAKEMEVAGRMFSLDDVEHGILRRSKIKWSLGYLSKLFPSKKEKALRVGKLDYRIHFALNCGAKSCPPIASYNNESLNQQLDLATKAYLTSEAGYNTSSNTIKLPILMSWFRADFGGEKGIKKLSKEHQIIPLNSDPKFNFKKYDWTLTLDNKTL